ncbi:MAG: hypothetical protein LBV27_03190, partial [Oscillospiraceae bacterium]|nr:hypothetical protein [Oscillospiraceae bacterium]
HNIFPRQNPVKQQKPPAPVAVNGLPPWNRLSFSKTKRRRGRFPDSYIYIITHIASARHIKNHLPLYAQRLCEDAGGVILICSAVMTGHATF